MVVGRLSIPIGARSLLRGELLKTSGGVQKHVLQRMENIKMLDEAITVTIRPQRLYVQTPNGQDRRNLGKTRTCNMSPDLIILYHVILHVQAASLAMMRFRSAMLGTENGATSQLPQGGSVKDTHTT